MSSAITPLVDAFPDDDKEYVVWAFGCLKKNTSDKSITPLVEVALVEIKHTGKLANETLMINVPILELDIIQLWTIWKNKKKQEKAWGNTTSASFKFDLSQGEIEPLEFFSKRPNSEEYYIPTEYYNFNCLHLRLTHNKTRSVRQYFSQAKLIKLNTWKGCEVFIPSLELFSSIYTPFEKEIRRKLLTKSFNEVVADYVNMDETYEKNGEYNISLRSSKDESNIIFLAYLALNSTTRKRVSKLWSSIMAGEGDYFPAISPYHPKGLEIKAEGLWLKKGKSFLVLRLKEYTLPDEIKINATYPRTPTKIKKSSQKTKKRRNNYLQHEIKEMAFTSEFDPGISHSPIYLSSDVKFKYDENILEQSFHAKESKEIKSGITTVMNQMIDAPHLISSGSNSYSQDNQHTTRVNIEHKNFTKKNIIEVVYKSLLALCNNKHVFISGVKQTCINSIVNYNEEGNKFESDGFGKFPLKLLSMKKIGPWSILKVDRKPKAIRSFLLARIFLDDKKSAYILEIQRSPTEQFSGMFFQIKNEIITKSNIEELLIAVASTKGRMTRHTDSADKTVAEIRQLHFIDKLHTFNHRDIQNDETRILRMSELIQSAIYHEVFR